MSAARPVLETGLSADAAKKRRATIGGSDANIILSGDERAILRLWEVKTSRAEPDDLSRVLPVRMGIQTEPLNLAWFEEVTGKPVERGSGQLAHPDYPWMTCHPDGLIRAEAAVLECKHVNAFARMEDVRARYMPQLHHNMLVTGWRKAYLSVFIGTLAHEWCEVPYDGWYAAEMMDRLIAFRNAVQADEPPVKSGEAVPLPAHSDMREIFMDGNNEWADAAHDWLANRKQAGWFAGAAKRLKAMTASDVRRASGHGVEVRRTRNNSLRISEARR
jgi:predicted phage-related endonuclease